ncbi:AraC family transcriptional regulator [Coralloluteibacterium stylophorae]|uniref:AraC family transcriptional regulator n=1 Tax=Coralloluteibacterium stylophorae TaxID=1776034 RepID=A0A8J8AWH7_9GAMM|nr:AraC family transcriptional regulator [Coralloluteibacterium stylophorae]MBS7456881.1 AraC family transcriptional regulator [Coralloluteibacterium stylophorae]
MADPLAEVVTLLQPNAPHAKAVVGAGAWAVRRSNLEEPFYCVLLEGACRLEVDAHAAVELREGDFALVTAAYGVTMTSLEPPPPGAATIPSELAPGRFRVGRADGPVDLRMLAGNCCFGSPDAALLVSLLPQVVHVRDERRLASLVQLVGDETRAQRPAREVVLARLLEVLLIEALRSTAGTAASPSLVRGLTDVRLAPAIRAIHAHPAQAWTVAALAGEAALSRSAFFERFSRSVGVAPMEYLLAWRMAIARNLLRRGGWSVAGIAEHVGYASASTFSVAFSRHAGISPMRYARAQRERSEAPDATTVPAGSAVPA